MTEDMQREAGRIGLVSMAGVVVVLVIHPFGTTDIYETGGAFLDHVTGFWVVLHLVAALLFAAFPLVFGAWSLSLEAGHAKVLALWATVVCVAGYGIGALHLIGTDTVTFWVYADTYEATRDTPAGEVGADVFLRLHAATLTSWITVFWFAAPAIAGLAALRAKSGPVWLGAMALIGAALQVPAVILTLSEGQWTTVSEQGFFRTGATFTILFTIGLALGLRRGAPIGQPAPAPVTTPG
ncbi:MAG: hypothetical protein AAGA90_06870 [Actinomycetota bacterium]